MSVCICLQQTKERRSEYILLVVYTITKNKMEYYQRQLLSKELSVTVNE